jgi:antibiotic biosynthesis monooxygenase (ABM) superfamily enzyme
VLAELSFRDLVPAMTYLVTPLLARLASPWLQTECKEQAGDRATVG